MKPWYNINKEYENSINEIRVEQGFTLKELASLTGVTKSYMWYISQGLTSPFEHGKSGEFKGWAVKLQKVFGCKLSEIFPREVCDIQTSFLTNEQIIDIAHGYNTKLYGDRELIFQLYEGLFNKISDIEFTVIYYRFYKEMTYAEIGEIINLSVERARQIECKGLRKIREYFWRIEKEEARLNLN